MGASLTHFCMDRATIPQLWNVACLLVNLIGFVEFTEQSYTQQSTDLVNRFRERGYNEDLEWKSRDISK